MLRISCGFGFVGLLMAPVDQLAVENELRDVVQLTVQDYLREIRSTVFRNPSRPDWAVWPSTLWPQMMARRIVPRMRQIYEELLAEQEVDETSIAAYSDTFANSLNDLVNDPHIPDRVLSQVQEVAFSPEYASKTQEEQQTILDELLIASAVLWTGMITVTAINAAGLTWNGSVYTAAIDTQEKNPDRTVLKTWDSHDDDRTRPTHRLVDNTTVGLRETFIVGGFPLRFPHDPFGPPQEIINCRCGLRYGVKHG